MEPFESNYIIALLSSVAPTNGSHDMVMSGGCYKLGREDVASGPIVSVCYVGLLVDECDGFGMPKTT